MRDEILDFWGDRDYGGCFETSWDFALAERVVVDFTEVWSKLFCTELQCRRGDILWACSFPDFQFPEAVPHLCWLDNEGRWQGKICVRMAGRHGGVHFIKSAVEVIQLIWERGVIICRCLFLFILGDVM